jgi:hypothetical protein
VTSNLSGINITLQDMPSVWGQVNYGGGQTGDVYVVAVTASNSWDTTYLCILPWVQGESSTTGGSVYISFPANYMIAGMPASNYWIRAFIDQNADGQMTPLEAAGTYSANGLALSNRVTGINFTINADGDGDGLPDWWENQYFGNTTSQSGGGDADGDGVNNLTEYQQGRDPTKGAQADSGGAVNLAVYTVLEK